MMSDHVMTLMAASPRIRCIRADNPSPMTGTGTNTYLVGTDDVVVIDPGPALPAHLDRVMAALGADGRITTILITHSHLDHSGLAGPLARRTEAPVLAFGAATAGRSALMTTLAAQGMTGGGEGVDAGFAPDAALTDGQILRGPDWALRAIHTPGHMGGHLCFAAGDILFSGDHVMGWASTLISPPDGDMGAYMASLDKLVATPWQMFLPGHGDPVMNPGVRLAELRQHRRAREAAVLAALANGPATIVALTALIYTNTHPSLMPAAARNVLAHLIDLIDRNRIVATPAPGLDAIFALR